jgi:hypothetical protein
VVSDELRMALARAGHQAVVLVDLPVGVGGDAQQPAEALLAVLGRAHVARHHAGDHQPAGHAGRQRQQVHQQAQRHPRGHRAQQRHQPVGQQQQQALRVGQGVRQLADQQRPQRADDGQRGEQVARHRGLHAGARHAQVGARTQRRHRAQQRLGTVDDERFFEEGGV